MALVHEFENSGNWLFRRRSWLPVFMVAAGIFMMYIGNRQAIIFDMRDEIIFLSVSLLGQLIRIFTVGFAPRNTSGRNTVNGQIADELNTTGIYSLIRHPLYLGNFFMWLGPVLFLRSVGFSIVFFLLYWIYYDKWSEKVASIIPWSFRYIPSTLPFSVRNVLKREYNSFVNIFVIFLLLDLFRNLFLTETFFFTQMWLYLTIGSAAIWLIVRTIHKSTKWLEVEGR
jgi:hypothetical protein